MNFSYNTSPNFKKRIRRLVLPVFFLSAVLFFGPILSVKAQQNPINDVRRAFKKVVRPIVNEQRRTQKDIDRTKRLFSKNKRKYDASTDTTDTIVWYKKPYIPNKGMIQDYSFVYQFLHRQEAIYFDQSDIKGYEIVWDSLNNLFFKNQKLQTVKDSTFKLFGWYPYWMEDASPFFRYDLLSMAAFYSYEINADDGSQQNPELFKALNSKGFLDSCRVNQVKPLLSVSLIGETPISRFLSSTEKQNLFYVQALAAVDTLGFDGIDINFEQIPASMRDAYTRFIRMLGAKLRQQGSQIGREQLLIVDMPYYDQLDVYDVKAFAPFIDYINVIGYNFTGEVADYPNSLAPLRSSVNSPNLETAVNDILNLDYPSSQIILSLPLFGDLWRVTDVEKGVLPEFENSLMYGDIQASIDIDYYPIYDSYTASTFYMLEGVDDEERYMFWYESDQSFNVKSAWMKEKGLGGMGLWALGYDKGDVELWQTMESIFTINRDSLVEIKPLKVDRGALFGVMKNILAHQEVFGLSFLFFASALFVGFMVSIFDWQVRDLLFKSAFFRYFNALLIFLFIFLGINMLNPFQANFSIIFTGFISGILSLLISLVVFNLYRKSLR